MEIRARISLEVSKLVANAKVAGDAFKAIANSSKISTDKIDGYIEKNLQNRLNAIEKIKVAEQRALQFSDASQARAAKKKSGSTELQFGVVGPQQTGRQYEFKSAMDFQSKITQAERTATAKRVAIANNAAKQKSDAERKRYNEWLKLNTRQTVQAKALAKQQSFQVKVDFFANDEDFNRRLAATRYALYDIGRRAIGFGVAVGAGMGLAVKAAIDFESAFTSVERTAQVDLGSPYTHAAKEAQNLKDALLDISTSIPVAFGEVTEIATLGAQLGIATEDLDDFTKTVAEFSAITGISVDKAALSFGRLSELLNIEPAEFDNLSSAIVYAGINAVATDAEVLKMSESIAAASTQAGLAAADTLGFATALASLKVRPEEARGVITRLFREFDLIVAESGSRLDDFAKVLGKTSEETAGIWKTDPSQFVQSFLKGAEASGALNETMTALGITNSRELNVITRLANNMDVLERAIADTNEQYLLGTFSSDAYAKVSDDLASKIIVLQNSIQALGADFGDLVSDQLKDVVDLLTSFTNGIAESPKFIKVIIGLLTALTAGLSIFIGLLTLGTAGLLALKLAFQNLQGGTANANISLSTFRALVVSMIPNAAGATTILGAMSQSFRAVGTGATGAGIAVRGFGTVMSVAFGPIGIAVGLLGAIGLSLVGMASEAEKAKTAMFDAAGGIDAVLDAASKDAGSSDVFREIQLGVTGLTEAEQKSLKTQKDSLVAREDSKAELVEQSAALKTTIDNLRDYKGAVDDATDAVDENTIAIGGNVAALVLDALGNYDGEGKNFWVKLTELSPDVESTLTELGFNAAEMVAAGLEEGGESAEDYAQRFETAIRLVAEATKNIKPESLENYRTLLADLGFEMTTEQLLAMNAGLDVSGARVSQLVGFLSDGGAATDNFTDSAVKAAVAAEKQGSAAKDLGEFTEDATGETLDLNDALRTTIGLLTASEISENKVSNALNVFAESAKETSGELDGMGNSAKLNLSNFASFMDAATEASIAAGEGTAGAVNRIVGGLNSLDAAGINTSDAYKLVQTTIINSMRGIAGADSQLKTSLAKAPNLAGMKMLVEAFYLAQVAAKGWSKTLRIEYAEAMAFFNQTGPAVEFKPINTAVKKTMTALEKLQEQISNVFKVKNIYADLYESLNKLAGSLTDNGKVFSIYSEAGRSNIAALQDTIDMFAKKSGGNVDKFANDLASLRAALVQAGAPVSALKMIDDTVKKIGVTGKSSAHDVNQFAKALASTGESVRKLYAVKSAMDAITSGLRQAFSAIFSQADALDAVTLGWLDMSEAADAARESITNAGYDIRDARLEIEKLDAEINGLAADKGKLQYQLSIALKYGDTLRANELRAEIAQLDADVAAKEASISDANGSIAESTRQIADANGVLGSNPTVRQQIERNEALRDMALRYGDVAASLIAAAEPGDDLNGIIEDQVTAFYNSAVQMGYSKTEAKTMADTLRDELIYQMNQIPEDITTDITAETSVATSAVSKFVDFANARLAQIKDKTVTVKTVYTSSGSASYNFKGTPVGFSNGGLVSGTGTGTSDSIPARLSSGEFVVRAAAVGKYGVDFFNSLNQMQSAPTPSFGSISQQSSGGGVVYLSTEDRQLLRAAIDRPITLYTDNATIAKSANDGNSILAQRGIR